MYSKDPQVIQNKQRERNFITIKHVAYILISILSLLCLAESKNVVDFIRVLNFAVQSKTQGSTDQWEETASKSYFLVSPLY